MFGHFSYSALSLFSSLHQVTRLASQMVLHEFPGCANVSPVQHALGASPPVLCGFPLAVTGQQHLGAGTE